MSLDYEQIKQEVKEELLQSLSVRFNHEKERKLTNYRHISGSASVFFSMVRM